MLLTVVLLNFSDGGGCCAGRVLYCSYRGRGLKHSDYGGGFL